MTTITRSVHFAYEGRRKRAVAAPPPATGDDRGPLGGNATSGRVPRVARLMALAIRFHRLLRDGTVQHQSELAHLCQVTQPRMTQIMNLLHLAPDIQEAILFLPPMTNGRDSLHEHLLRQVCAVADWQEQRRRWKSIRAATDQSPSA